MSDIMTRMSAMAQALLEAQKKVDKISADLVEANNEVSRIELEDLPDLMKELEIKSIVLEDGSSITVKEEVKCGITDANKPAALKWLEDNGFGGLIKTSLELSFGKGEHEEALSAAEAILHATGRAPEMEEGVHHSTLKSFVIEQREKGADLPLDLFGIHPYNRAKLAPPKVKKSKANKQQKV